MRKVSLWHEKLFSRWRETFLTMIKLIEKKVSIVKKPLRKMISYVALLYVIEQIVAFRELCRIFHVFT